MGRAATPTRAGRVHDHLLYAICTGIPGGDQCLRYVGVVRTVSGTSVLRRTRCGRSHASQRPTPGGSRDDGTALVAPPELAIGAEVAMPTAWATPRTAEADSTECSFQDVDASNTRPFRRPPLGSVARGQWWLRKPPSDLEDGSATMRSDAKPATKVTPEANNPLTHVERIRYGPNNSATTTAGGGSATRS